MRSRRPERGTTDPVRLSATLAVAFGVLAVSLSGLDMPAFADGGLDLEWGATMEASRVAQDDALRTLLQAARLLAVAAASVCVLTLMVLALASASTRVAEAATRAAVGASPLQLARWGLERQLRGVPSAVVAGGTGGLVLAALARATWPGTAEPVRYAAAGAQLSTGVVVLVGILCATALMPLLAGGRDPRRAMGSGDAVVSRYPTGLRWALPVAQLGITAGLLTVAGLLVGAGVADDTATSAAHDAIVLSVSVDESERNEPALTGVLAGLGEGSRGASSSVAGATPGAFVGLGVRDQIMAECGVCYLGGLFVPLQGARARHHAVTPDTFALMGISLLDGREFTPTDGPGAPPVAVVNEALVREVFHDGSPVGRHIRLGRGLGSWYEVIGVVDRATLGAALGGGGEGPAVFVSALQHPPRTIELFVAAAAVRGTERGTDLLTATAALPFDDYLAAHTAPMRWLGRLMLLLGAASGAVSLVGVSAVMRFVASRRRREVALRIAVGASTGAIWRFLMSEGARLVMAGAVVGLWLSFSALALARELAGRIPEGAIVLALGMTAALALAGLGGVAAVARSVSMTEPRAVLTSRPGGAPTTRRELSLRKGTP